MHTVKVFDYFSHLFLEDYILITFEYPEFSTVAGPPDCSSIY